MQELGNIFFIFSAPNYPFSRLSYIFVTMFFSDFRDYRGFRDKWGALLVLISPIWSTQTSS